MPFARRCSWSRKDATNRFDGEYSGLPLAKGVSAFVGVSRQSKDFSRAQFREFRARGYDAVPVHPAAGPIEGIPCVRHLSEIQPPVDSVLLMTSPGVTEVLVRECVQAGVKRVWL